MMGRPPWNIPLAPLLIELRATSGGLTSEEAKVRLAEYGANDALVRRRRPLWRQILERFANPLVLILLFAASLSAWTGQVASFVIIIVIILLSVVLDLAQQLRAENAVEALRRIGRLARQVCRDGRERTIAVEQLVPGDVVRLAAGDLVPADCRLIDGARPLRQPGAADRRALPGREARRATCRVPQRRDPGGRSTPVHGHLRRSAAAPTAVVCRTGEATELGRLARHAAPRQRPPDAFELGIRQFGFLMLRFTIFLVLFVLAANVLFQRPWLESLLFALALAVGLTPELLPMVVTVTLARGALRLAQRRVIVKRLAAIHDLGAMDVLCTDKTGTLTEARIRLVAPSGRRGRDSERVLRLAYLNSAFESGIKSPLDEAILAHRQARRDRLDEDRRGAVRLRAPARLGPGRRRHGAAAGRQGCAGGRIAALDRLRSAGGGAARAR